MYPNNAIMLLNNSLNHSGLFGIKKWSHSIYWLKSNSPFSPMWIKSSNIPISYYFSFFNAKSWRTLRFSNFLFAFYHNIFQNLYLCDTLFTSQKLFLFSRICVLAISRVHKFGILFLHQISHHQYLVQFFALVRALEFSCLIYRLLLLHIH